MHRRTFVTAAVAGTALGLVPTLPAAAAGPYTTLDALQQAIDRAVPGDRLVLANGTYTVPANRPIRVSGRNGTTAAPITIAAESKGGVVLQGAKGFEFADSGNITVTGFAFRQSSTLEIPESCSRIRLTRNDFRLTDTTGFHWLVVSGNDVKVDRNRFHDKSTAGVFLVLDGPGADRQEVAKRLTVLRNHFSDHRYTGSNGGEAIRLGVSHRALGDADATVEYNLFERCDGDAEAVSVKSSGNTVRYNTLRDSRGGIVLRHGNGSTVEGNHLLDGGEGIRLYGNDHVVVNNHLTGLTGRALVIGSGSTRDHYAGEPDSERTGHDACDRALVLHNTLAGNAGGLSGEERTYEPRNVVIADNLLVAERGTLVGLGRTTGFTWQGNILWGAAANGTAPAGGWRRVDPRLVRGADGVNRLSAGSPAIGAAGYTGTRAVTEDVDGQPRGTARDVGADQYSTQPPVRRPLTTADVGPDAP
ncbi:polysaccharide lyase 6 family protein [Kitasatospora sp. NPDC051853]|uniref:polysaccharide lyase 6 family protein n=1 Tax=Kitasatospora sp. NPDC051853 TaxID=3364058 RepID=UPI0037A9D9E6